MIMELLVPSVFVVIIEGDPLTVCAYNKSRILTYV